MENTFDLKKFLVENKLTTNSKTIKQITEGSNRSDAIVTATEEEPQTPKETFVELKPEKYQGREIPAQANYRIVYMYSDEPKYEMFTKREPSDSDMEKFIKIAPEKFEIGDGITALDRNNEQVNYVRLLDNKGFFRRPGDLMPMIM